MDLRNLVDVSPFLLFEATGDSDQVGSSDQPSTMEDRVLDQDNDDAESCSYDLPDHGCSSYSCSCVTDDFNGCDDEEDTVMASYGVVGDDDEYEKGEEEEIHWAGEYVEEKPSSSVDSSKEVMMMNEMEKSRIFWETCLAS